MLVQAWQTPRGSRDGARTCYARTAASPGFSAVSCWDRGRPADARRSAGAVGRTTPAAQSRDGTTRSDDDLRAVCRIAMANAGPAYAEALHAARLSQRPPEPCPPGLARLAAARHRSHGRPAVDRGQVPAASGLANRAQCLGLALGHPRDGG